MSLATSANCTATRAARDLEAALRRDFGPDPRELRQAADDLFTAAGWLLQAVADIETGLVD